MVNNYLCQVSFKEVFTNNVITLQVNPFITVTKFIETKKMELSEYFNINNDSIEIVECGQINSQDICLDEMAPALLPSETLLCNIWGDEMASVSFYVRSKNYEYTQLSFSRIQESSRCPICLESHIMNNIMFDCSHGICHNCENNCRENSINRCPICRASSI